MFVMPVVADIASTEQMLKNLGLCLTRGYPKPVMITGGVAEVPLSRGAVAFVDPEDAAVVAALNWCAYRPRGGNGLYATAAVKRISGETTIIRLHRFLLGLREKDGMEVDHRDGNGLNNRRSNLRVCRHSENLRNRRLGKNNASGFKGVYFSKRSGLWRAEIEVDDRRHRLGYFPSAELAAAAYDAAAINLHGEFALTNKMLAA